MKIKLLEKILQDLKEKGRTSICPQQEEEEVTPAHCQECQNILVGKEKFEHWRSLYETSPCPCTYHRYSNTIPELIEKVENHIKKMKEGLNVS